MIKKIIIIGAVAISGFTVCANWVGGQFPNKNPSYHFVEKNDNDFKSKINLSCTKDFKDLMVITISGVDSFKLGTFTIVNRENKHNKSGIFSASIDGQLNLISTSFDLTTYLKKEMEASIVLTEGRRKQLFVYDLKGSSKSINALQVKCKNLK